MSSKSLIAVLAPILMLAALHVEVMTYFAKRHAQRAQRMAGPAALASAEAVLAEAERALAFNPNDAQALYLKAVKLKDLERWEKLGEALPAMLAMHPSQASLRRLAGEQAYRAGDSARAADLLWQAMRINPAPPASPAALWRMTMLASQGAGRADEAFTAGLRALALAPGDPLSSPADRAEIARELAALAEARGWPETARHLIKLAERN